MSSNIINTSHGTIRMTGRAGLNVSYHGKHVRVSTEMLDPPMSIVIYQRDTDTTNIADPETFFRFVIQELETAGFTVYRGN